MKRNIKILLAGLAVLALVALTASAASATVGEWDFGSSVEKVDLTGTQVEENVFTVNGGTVKCKEASFTGTVTGTPAATVTGGTKVHFYSHTITLHPKYGACTAFGQFATVTTEEGVKSCNYLLTPTLAGGTASIECTKEFSITIKANTAGCTVKVGAQTPINNRVDFTGEGFGNSRDIMITSTVGPTHVEEGGITGIKYTSSGGICGKSGENGKYSGTVTEKGYKDGSFHLEENQVPIFIAETVE